MKKQIRIQEPVTITNWTKFPNSILDNLLDFSGIETRILALMVRKNIGYSKPNKQFSINYLALKLGHSKTSIKNGLDKLIAKKTIIQIKTGTRGIRHFDINWQKQALTGPKNGTVKKPTVPKNGTVTVPKNGTVLGQKMVLLKENKVKENNIASAINKKKEKQASQCKKVKVARVDCKPEDFKFNFVDFCKGAAAGLQCSLFPAALRWTDDQVGFLKHSLNGGGRDVAYLNNKAALATAKSNQPGGWWRYFQRAVNEDWSPEFQCPEQVRAAAVNHGGRQVRYQGAEYTLSELGTLTMPGGVVAAGDVSKAISSGVLEVLT
ncbi:MAG: replication protein [Desulfobacteraceae bacterium]|nr:replication protein [Desulfobacteraceae bacterium]